MAGPYVIASLTEVSRAERHLVPPGATVVLVTAVITPSLAREVAEMRGRGHPVMVLYAGDGAPERDLPGVRVYHVGRALASLEEHEPVLAH